jgi:predicted nucleic acid-binding protein
MFLLDTNVVSELHRDSLIAATALVHGLTLVTRNIADFEGTETILLDPWGE